MGCKSYHRLLKKLPASAVQKRLIKNSGGRMHRMLLVSEEGVLALLKHCGHKAATGFKRYLETCVIPVIRREIDTARIMLPESEKTHKDQEEKENMEEAIRMLSSALFFGAGIFHRVAIRSACRLQAFGGRCGALDLPALPVQLLRAAVH